jgi:FKBP-type peptidyl-prolyl cis-trans isomerase
MKTIARLVIIVLSAAGLAGCTSQSQTQTAAAAKPAPAATAPAATVSPAADTNGLSTVKARNSYAIGMTLGHNFQVQEAEVDPELLARGMKDTMSGGATLLTQDEMRATMGEFQKTLMAKQRQMREAAAIKNKAAGEAFLATNKNNSAVITLPDGLQYVVITNGTGNIPEATDIVTMNYRTTLLDGNEVESTYKRGQPAKIPVNNVFPGWAEALQKMNVGSQWRLFIPAQLAYGEQGGRNVPANSAIIMEVELLGVEHPAPPEPLTSDIVKVPSLEEMKKGAKIEVIKPEDAAKAQAATTNQPAK